MTQELKPCPICGFPPAIAEAKYNHGSEWWVACINPDCKSKPEDARSKAIRLWNERTQKP